jgi:hypothetical protein
MISSPAVDWRGIGFITLACFGKILASASMTMETKALSALAILGLTHCGWPPHAACQAEGAAD